MTAYLNMALVQIASPSMHPDLNQRKRENFAKMEFYIDMIFNANPSMDLIAFPELYINGIDIINWFNMAESIPGPITELFCAKAKQYKKWLVPGSIIEKGNNPGEAYNSALLISPEGEIVMKYRKVFVPYPLEPSTPGDQFPVYEIPGICKVGFMICSDGHWPEAARNLVLKGAEVIIKPTLQGHWIGGTRNHTEIAVTRAVENQCYLVSINQPSPLGMGDSLAVDPEGRIIERLGSSESFTMVYLNIEELRRIREMGFAGMFSFIKMLKELKEMGRPVDECYTRGLTEAPIYQTFKNPNPKTPAEIKKYNG